MSAYAFLSFLLLAAAFGPQEEGEFEKRERKKAEPFQKRLEKDPEDAEANEMIGRLYCFILGDWAKGLPLFEKAKDKDLKALASKELGADPKDLAAKAPVADGWWSHSAKLKGSEAKAARAHAAALYRTAIQDAPKADRKRIVARINQQLAEAGPSVIKLQSNVAWFDTGLDIAPGESIDITATGKWCWDKNLETGGTDYKGYQRVFEKLCPHPTAFAMCLIFKIGESGKIAAAYKDCPYNASVAGRLLIGCNDFGPADNTGELVVTIKRLMN